MKKVNFLLLSLIESTIGNVINPNTSDYMNDDFDLEKEYQLIQEKKSKYSSNDRRIILNMYNNRIGDVK